MLFPVCTRRVLLAACLALAAVAAPPARAASGPQRADVPPEKLTLPLPKTWTGDFDGMRQRRVVRVLVPYSRAYFFLDRGAELGILHDIGAAFEDYLNKKYPSKSLRMRVAFVPVASERLIEALLDGTGDVAAGGLTVTPERQTLVDFTVPVAVGVKEIVVEGKGAARIASLDDLAGRTVTVAPGSSYYAHLAALNARFRADGRPEMRLVSPGTELDEEGILELANAGVVALTVIDRYAALFWKNALTEISVRDDLVVAAGNDIALAVRKNSPLLLAELNGFLPSHRYGTAFFDTLLREYLKTAKYVTNPADAAQMARFNALVALFRKYGEQYGFDYLMLLAQGYQESQLDQGVRSRTGAVGVMQLLPATAASPEIGITGIERDPDRNIHAGVRYLRYLADRYLNDPGLDEKNKTLMAFAAYNAGPGNLQRYRDLAQKAGYDRNKWFNNVEIAAAKLSGRQTVDYVSNIAKYYVAYKLIEEREQAAAKP